MENAVINRAYFERALLFLSGKGSCGDIYFSANGISEKHMPLYCEQSGVNFTVCFDLASGFGGHPLPNAKWELHFDGAVSCTFDQERDFSDNGGIYKVKVISDQLGINLFSTFKASKKSVKVQIADIALKAIFKTANVLPKNGKRVLFTSQSRNELSGNEKYIYDEIWSREKLKNCLDIRFALSNKSSIGFYLRTAWQLGRCDTIILDDYHPIVYRFKYKDGIKIAQLWHACGAFKTFGYSRLGKEGAPRFDGNAHRCYTHAFVSGEDVRKYYAEAFGIPLDRVYATGIPRCDSLSRIERQHSNKFTIIFAPTFRGNGAISSHYPYEMIDTERLADLCREKNMRVIFKMHPFIKERVPIKESQRDVLFDESGMREINQLLPYADLIITDYSSVIYEAALLDIPMLFYTFDLDEYTEKRDFYQPFQEFAPGKIVYDFDSLIESLANSNYQQDKIKPFRDKNFTNGDISASSRIVDILFENC